MPRFANDMKAMQCIPDMKLKKMEDRSSVKIESIHAGRRVKFRERSISLSSEIVEPYLSDSEFL